MALQIYMWIYLFSYIFSLYSVILENKYSKLDILLAALSISLSYFLMYQLYLRYKKRDFHAVRFSFKINDSKFTVFMFFYLILYTVYALCSGDVRAGSEKVTSSSIFASLWPPNGIFLFYYCIEREKHKCSVYLISVLFVVYNFMNAYTGIIFMLPIIELYFRKRKKMQKFLAPLAAGGAVVLGGGLYSILYPLKFYLRNGSSPNPLSLIDGINNLCLRFSHLKTTVYSKNNFQIIINKYKLQAIDLIEAKGFFRPLIPSLLYENKLFSNFGSIVHNLQTGYSLSNGSDSPDILTYANLIIKSDLWGFILWVLLIIICLYVIRYICCCFQYKNGQFDILYFWIIVNGMSICGNLESLFSGTYLKIIFFIPLLWVTGVIRIVYRGNYKLTQYERNVYESTSDNASIS